MTKQLSTTDEVIAALGGPTAVARIVGLKSDVVNNWRGAVRGRFPSYTFLALSAALKDLEEKEKQKFSVPASLWGMLPPASRQRESA